MKILRPQTTIALLMLSAAAAGEPSGQTITVWSYGYAPKPVHLAAGQPVTLVFVNRSHRTHDFTARQFFANSTISAGDVHGGEVELAPYETKRVTLIPRAGTYEAHCSHFFHMQLGMRDVIIVD